ncbi:hypothetical protein L915_07878 [Phytophthora nicotianae]|uniref:Calponin-homology (CH) domain-containing protein n=1 Tax=Phytophthora nicotianae TaxID=4792 RepID=W2GXY7_PHYNI|nr:hypothetical protein L915_07878 [Phytophthora nicotianae]
MNATLCGSPASSTMNLSGGGDSVHERLLLHWVNSLPLTKCLLVEGLRDLRFGDVLYEIVQWLQHNSADAGDGISEGDGFDNDGVVERLHRVVQFAASECRSQDEDAMYIVNDSNCIARVISGESDATCAVLTVLKRLSRQRIQQHQLSESKKNELRRREQEKMIELSLQRRNSRDELSKEDEEPKQKSKRVQTSSSRSQTRAKTTNRSEHDQKASTPEQRSKTTKQGAKKQIAGAKRSLGKVPTTTTSAPTAIGKKKMPLKANVMNEGNGLHVQIDPVAKYHSGDHFSEDARAVRFCNWARLVLQVEMPLKKVFDKQSGRLNSPCKIRQVFANGVLFRRIAAAIVQRCNGLLNHNIPGIDELRNEDFARLQTPAGIRRNFSLALTTFKTLGISQAALNAFEIVQSREKQDLHKRIWCHLDEILNKVEQREHAGTASKSKTAMDIVPKTLLVNGNQEETKVTKRSPKRIRSPRTRRKKAVGMGSDHTGCAPLKRSLPYITNEQMHVVDEWLVNTGFDSKKVISIVVNSANEWLPHRVFVQVSGRGVLQDPIRNGVLLCALLVQDLKSAPFSYFKTPRTLAEMRENISKAFKRLGEHVPPCYLTSSAEQSVLIGDRQIAYGILWYLWQASQETFTMEKAKKGTQSSSISIHETRKAEEVNFGGKRSARVQPSPLVLDIPAIALAAQGKLVIKDGAVTSHQVKLHDSFARRLAWSEHDLPVTEDVDDDVFPVPKAPFSSPVYNDDVDIVPAKIHDKHHVGDDLFPTHPQRRESVESLSDSIQSSIPKTREVSGHSVQPSQTAAVVTPIAACTDSIELVEQNKNGAVEAPSPVKPPVQTQLSINLSPGHVEEILTWLKRLGIRLKSSSAFHDSNAKLMEFQSGVLLCSIVEKVEFMRSIPGITRPTSNQPLSKASALHNITKALNILRQKKTMPLHLLRRATAIYVGNRDVILHLLLQIRKTYGHHLRTSRRPKQNLSSAA